MKAAPDFEVTASISTATVVDKPIWLYVCLGRASAGCHLTPVQARLLAFELLAVAEEAEPMKVAE